MPLYPSLQIEEWINFLNNSVFWRRFQELPRHFHIDIAGRYINNSFLKDSLIRKIMFGLFGWNNRPAEISYREDDENMIPPNSGRANNVIETVKQEKSSSPSPYFSAHLLEVFYQSVNLKEGRLKNRDAAILIMRLLIKSDYRLINCKTESFHTENYLNLLDRIEKTTFTQNSFSGDQKNVKHVLGIEGLKGTGKMTIIQQMQLLQPTNIEIVQRQSMPKLLKEIKNPLLNLVWDCLETYHMALQVMDSSKSIVILDNYYHAFFVKNYEIKKMKTSLSSSKLNFPDEEEVTDSMSNEAAFSWPIDLPMPELVSE
jgi:hypothetical protein